MDYSPSGHGEPCLLGVSLFLDCDKMGDTGEREILLFLFLKTSVGEREEL